MYTLHIANKLYSSWSMRPWVLMRQLDIPFREVMHRFGDAADWAAYGELAPHGKVPSLEDGPTVVWDSLSIVEYLAETYPQVWPADAHARAWARSAVAEMHSGFQALRQHCSMHCNWRVRLHAVPEAVRRDVKRIEALWLEGLTRFGGPYLAGRQFTAVDAFYAPVALRFQTYGLEPAASVNPYWQRLLTEPAVQAWQEQAHQEPWADPAHEQDILAAGVVWQDLRAAGV